MIMSVLTPDEVFETLATVRDRRPRVHCITNAVAQNFTANMLLALGAVPSMTIAANEVREFTSRSQALLVNIGTMDRDRSEAIDLAIEVAGSEGIPWALDPVFAHSSTVRADLARRLAARRPDLIRGNAGEFEVLLEAWPDEDRVAAYAAENRLVAALTGAIDFITDGPRRIKLAQGDPLMDRVTAMGCAGTAVLAAFLGSGIMPLTAAAAGLTVLGVAGEMAAARATGPGTFAVHYLDAVYRIGHHDLAATMKEAET